MYFKFKQFYVYHLSTICLPNSLLNLYWSCLSFFIQAIKSIKNDVKSGVILFYLCLSKVKYDIVYKT